ncbi:MAG TPA: hypothetical protein VFY87_01085 [Geminicoccaceae bacterium]|nr:hypothetical protein [Geminicoccaceae bacterium]
MPRAFSARRCCSRRPLRAEPKRPSATPAAAGRVACIAGKLCACGLAPGGQATGLPAGFRWNCGILRPACGGGAPVTVDAWQGGLPDALAIDNSRTIVRQEVTGKGRRPGYPGRRP